MSNNFCRFYQVEDGNQQHELTRSKPNELQPTVEWNVPPEVEVTKVKVVVGYGNTDVYIYTTPMLFEESVESIAIIERGELPSIEPLDKARRKSEPQ